MVVLFDLSLALFVFLASALIYKLLVRENKQVEQDKK